MDTTMGTQRSVPIRHANVWAFMTTFGPEYPYGIVTVAARRVQLVAAALKAATR